MLGGSNKSSYIVANNDGDTIALGGPDIVVIGGTGNDSLTGQAAGSRALIVAGSGTSVLTGDGPYSQEDIFVYNGGVDTINGFQAGTTAADVLDLSSVPGATDFAEIMADASQNGANTVLSFGTGQSVTFYNVATSALTANNFVFSPIAALVTAPGTEADTGATVQLTLAISNTVSVNTAGGLPTLTLSDGATATYNATSSNPSGHLLVFDYTVAAGDQSSDLAITSFNANGATIEDAAGHQLDAASAANLTTGLQINPSPLNVDSISATPSGEADAGQQVTITLQMNEPVDVVYNPDGLDTFGLDLDDGSVAAYSASLSNPSAATLVFSYTVGTNDHAPDLEVTGIETNPTGYTEFPTQVRDSAGNQANFAGAIGVSTGLRIGPPLYVSTITSDRTAGPTGVGAEADAGQTVHITLALNEAVTLDTSSGTPTLLLSDGNTATYDATASGTAAGTLVFDDVVGASDHSPNLEVTSFNPNNATIQNAAGQAANFSGAIGTPIGGGLQIGPSPLTITNVSGTNTMSSGSTSTTITLTMSEAVTLSYTGEIGLEGLVLNNGALAEFDGVSGNQIFFGVLPGDGNDDDANVSINSVVLSDDRALDVGTLEFHDANGYNADLTAALNVSTGLVTGDALYVTSLATSAPSGEAASGQLLQITLDLSEGATVAGGLPSLILNDGGAATYDPAISNPGSGTLVFNDTPTAAEEFASLGIDSVNLNGANVTDATGNTADFSILTDLPLQLQVGPAVVLSVASTAIGDLTAGATTNFDLVMSQNVSIDTSDGLPTVILSNGATARYDAALTAATASDGPSSVGQIIFDYTVGTSDTTSNLEIAGVSLDGAIITDVVSGAAADLSGADNQYLGVFVEAACYRRGTMIATPDGDIRVEALAIGGRVCTAGGAVRPVIWLGHRHIDCRRHADPDAILPVRVRAHAFAYGQPYRDLFLSPNHAVFADGILIPVKHLINGRSIAQIDCHNVEYWHVELAQHDILLADNLAAESYLDTGNRHAFGNSNIIALNPDSAPLSWDRACAELVEQGPRLVAVKQRLFERAATSARSPAHILQVIADQQVLRPVVSGGIWHISVPKGARSLNLVSPPWMPAACFPASLDRRWLGVRLFGIAIDDTVIALDDAALFSGFHATEQAAEGTCRWTTGDARLVLPIGVANITFQVGDEAVPHARRLATPTYSCANATHGRGSLQPAAVG